MRRRLFYSRPKISYQTRSWARILFFGTLSIGLLLIAFSAGPSFIVSLASWANKKTVAPTTSQVFLPAPILLPLPEATNSGGITILGLGQKDISVEVFLNDQSLGRATADTEGKFEILASLDLGDNQAYAKSFDLMGNSSPPSEKLKITYDKTPPLLEIKSPADQGKFRQEKNRSIAIEGVTEPDASLTFNERVLVVDRQGGFTATLRLVEGENKLKFVATDLAGNQTEEEITVSFSLY
ncbi:hypothetical protein FJZ40_04640 [Candidatus Shapirobacteria bacterium]|nr:hypothetical protein [Candidatus Shapirobacteria bacterium]